MKSTTLELEVKPQALDQSNRVKVKQSKSWLLELDTSLNVHRLRSFQIIHIKHKLTMEQDSKYPTLLSFKIALWQNP